MNAMETRKKNQIRMFNTTNTSLSNYSPKWADYSPIEAAVANFRAEMSKIDLRRVYLAGLNNDTRKKKEFYYYRMEETCIKVCRLILAYAEASGDISLRKQMSITKSVLLKLSDAEKIAKVKMVIEKASPIIDTLEEYQVTQDDLDLLQQHISDYQQVMTAPKMNLNLKSELNTEIKISIKNALKYLHNIDHLMAHFQDTEKEFYEMYFKARVILDYGHGHKINPTAATDNGDASAPSTELTA